MYDKTDPRAELRGAKASLQSQQILPAQFALFYKNAPNFSRPLERTWLARGQNFLVAYSQTQPGARLERVNQVDEYMMLLPDYGTDAIIECQGEHLEQKGFSLVVLPPGNSFVTLPKGGRAIRVFSNRYDVFGAESSDMFGHASQHRNASYEPWPEPPGGYKVRSYSLDVPAEPGRFGRIFRCTTLMVNILDPQNGPRDTAKLSPHHHDDFEQGSLSLDGAFTHHLRWPWTTDLAAWREDQHMFCRSPSLIVIPPSVIHTSQAMDQGLNQLVDIFAPPRVDFSRQAGWVLNADDYLLPGQG